MDKDLSYYTFDILATIPTCFTGLVTRQIKCDQDLFSGEPLTSYEKALDLFDYLVEREKRLWKIVGGDNSSRYLVIKLIFKDKVIREWRYRE